MLATFVIGLREGLEAALIVGIVAAFLRKNGKSLTAMWLGVALAIVLSIAVGVGLDLVEKALPQSAQEGMEAVIGAVAIFFVTGMIVWMNAHARDMKRRLEAEAAEALGQASAYALASMAFLAVLREGFETSVFLLATFSAAQSAVLAAAGAVIGLLLAVLIGWGIYAGGVRINLSRFFRITGAFLILVAAGLVITSLRAAHEAGWLNAGQQPTVNLAWLVAPGTVRSALITGVLGIPADPRLIEILGWFAYLVPVALFIYWPASLRPGPLGAVRLKFALAAALMLAALGPWVFYPVSPLVLPAVAPLVGVDANGSGQPIGTARLIPAADGVPAMLRVALDGASEVSLPLTDRSMRREQRDGRDVSAWSLDDTRAPAGAAPTLSLDQVAALAGGRLPVGFSPSRHPGPFAASWSVHRSTDIWTAAGALLDAAAHSTAIVTLSGGGLQTPRTLTLDGAGDAAMVDWRVSAAYRDQVSAAFDAHEAAKTERLFWTVQLPVALVLAAFLLAAAALRGFVRLPKARRRLSRTSNSNTGRLADPAAKEATHAAH